jgi:hypothetical protein
MKGYFHKIRLVGEDGEGFIAEPAHPDLQVSDYLQAPCGHYYPDRSLCHLCPTLLPHSSFTLWPEDRFLTVLCSQMPSVGLFKKYFDFEKF